MPGKPKDLTGQRFNRLVAVRNVGHKGKTRHSYWETICDCGQPATVNGAFLTSGVTKSCGCLRAETSARIGTESKTHGLSKSPTYKIWSAMIQRCTNENVDSYKYYGAKGIKVCSRWMDFENFLEDMGPRPDGLTLDRIDSKKDYCKENCKWSTVLEQNRNTSRNRFITREGETLCVGEWAERHGLGLKLVNTRLNYGWGIERALTQPVVHKSGRPKKNIG